MDYWFIGCTHWGHRNIIKYQNRPFSSLEEMDEKMIFNWNERVKDTDIIYHLGDFIFGRNNSDFDRIFNRLKGKIILIKGNHESLAWANRDRFFEHYDSYKEIKINNQHIVLSHYPLLVWNRKHHGSIMLCSHSHYNLSVTRKEGTEIGKILDVGVDGNDFKPYNFEEIMQIMDKKPIFPRNPLLNDHHRANTD
jgi:calcineurin-like phosphoesterase family protein